MGTPNLRSPLLARSEPAAAGGGHSIATVSLSGTLEQKLAAAADAGFTGVELFEPDLSESRLSGDDVRLVLADLGLRAELFQPFRDFEGVSAERLRANLRRAQATFEVMHELGADMVLVCSNTAPDTIDDDGLAAEQLHTLADHASVHGVRVAYEALAWGRHVSEYDHAWRIVAEADHPSLGVCLDSFHILARGTPLQTIAEIPPHKLLFCQLADAPHLDIDVLQWSRHHRCLPGDGDLDLVDFTARVLGAGYDGPLSLELFNDAFRQAEPERVARDARRSLRTLEESVRAPIPAGARAPLWGVTSGEREGDHGHSSG